MKKNSVLVLLLFSTFLVADGLHFGEPIMNGPGCSPGSVSWALSPSNNSLSILFGTFSLTANPDSGLKRSYCEIITQVSTHNQTLIEADYRGFHDLPIEAISDWRVSYSLDNNAIVSRLDSAIGDDINPHTYSHQVNITCNGTRMLRIFAENILTSSSTDRNATDTLDSIDLGQANTPDIALQICNGASHISLVIPALMSALFILFSI
ncbi:MAG: DUF4360 domain-containing protein [Myxococcaceae bacterium]